MLDKMVLGRYIPGNSYIHQLDPRMKFIFVFLFTIIIFLFNNWVTYAMGIIITLIIMMLAKLKLSFLINGLKPILFILLFTLLMHVFFTKGGVTLVEYKWFNIQSRGVELGIQTVLRFVIIIFITTIMTLTTSPIELTDAIESLFKPLKKLKLPVHEFALMMSISLRFIPTLMDETTRVMNAQSARGSDIQTGSLPKRIRALMPLLIPLFISAFKRAEELAIAMEVRGYRGDIGRTKYKQLIWERKDTNGLLMLIPILLLTWLLRS
ncbi:energy-coupling factor transporter transmembrane protein EcfT [Macrococcus sp. DPC7161]|uniref:energy-coupling factor transporter transmembrane component T family protein n=1 Tax=Macrococcus sp. DPC7161 TaxID=2507060 RepID=UPI00100C0AF0|nr:energy-coupling factor transporter transmembrane protein EcfT [Macrococcus sp. DPC7161]RXK18695.1 energy-coupling factor transporter transmembrane protein EcfT [Macrococcus sp. DPC7161]